MLTIGSKLGMGIAVLLILCILIGIVSYVQTRHVRQKVEEITEVREPLNSAVYGMENNLMETAFASLGYLATGDTSLLNAFNRSKEHFSAIQRKYRDVAKGDTMVRFNARLQDGFAQLHAVAVEQILLRDQQAEKMHVLLKNLDAIDSLLNKRIQPSITADDPLAYRRLKAALEMEVNVNALTKGLGNFLLTGQPEFESRIELAEREFARYFRIYQNVLLSAKEKKWATELHTLSSESLEQAKSIIALEHRRTAQLAQFFDIDRELQSTLNDGLQLRTEASLSEAKREALHAEERANTIVIIVLFVSIGFGVGAGLLTTRSITRPLDQLAEAMHSIAHGDRVRRVEIRSGEDLRSLGDAFNLMTGHLVQANEELRAEVVERQRAEDALRISEEQFRLSIESVKDYAIFMLDQDGRVSSWNAGAERMSGYPPEEVLGTDFSIFYPVEDVQSAKPLAHLQSARAEGRVEDEGWRVRADGSRFWANVVMTAVRNQDGSLRGFSKVTRDATERKKMEEQLEQAHLERSTALRNFAVAVQRAQEEERARISRELHDDLCQRLSGMKFTVEVLGDEVEPVNKRVYRQLHDVTEELDRTISEVRRISSNLRPSVLDDFGLVIALKLLCKEFQAHHSIDAALQVDRATPERIDRHIEIALYRIAQEALTNVAKHASAKNVGLNLSYEHGTIKMAISDDGKGFNQEDRARAKDSGHGYGLMIMRERSELLGGACDISSDRRRGTTISVTVPVAEKEAYEKD
ncbi:MAG TPA: PAS domain S-box protein [Bacteroidota bacterium]|nr:PAS domain S-box protein [Bacteroidota bacterium]